MTREIDIDNLDADDARYLQDRPWKVNEAKLQGVDDIEDRIKEALDPTPELETDEDGVVDYDKLTLPELKQLAEERNLSRTGSKAELLDRVKTYDGAGVTVSREAEGAQAAITSEGSE